MCGSSYGKPVQPKMSGMKTYQHDITLIGQPLTKPLRLVFAIALVCVATVTMATTARAQPQASVDQQIADWRQANEAAGRFLRGHIDILKAEAKGTALAQDKDSAGNQGEILTLSQAKRRMLVTRPSLFATGNESAAEKNDHAVMVTMTLLDLERRWLQAVGSTLLLERQEKVTESAQIAAVLAERMGVVGNWGVDRVLQTQLQANTERLNLVGAGERAEQTRLALAELVGLDNFALPDELPAIRGIGARSDLSTSPEVLAQQRLERLPDYQSRQDNLARLEDAVGPESLAQWRDFAQNRIDAMLQGQDISAMTIDRSKLLWNHDLREALYAKESLLAYEREALVTMKLAQAAVKARHAEALMRANEHVPLSMAYEEEAVYQYNGMFISTWQLLAQFSARMAAEMAAIESQLRYLDTDLAYQAYLQGAPYSPPAGGAGENTEAASAAGGGH